MPGTPDLTVDLISGLRVEDIGERGPGPLNLAAGQRLTSGIGLSQEVWVWT